MSIGHAVGGLDLAHPESRQLGLGNSGRVKAGPLLILSYPAHMSFSSSSSWPTLNPNSASSKELVRTGIK
jgi:hypothetical protein